jgi:hypothetical protein
MLFEGHLSKFDAVIPRQLHKRSFTPRGRVRTLDRRSYFVESCSRSLISLPRRKRGTHAISASATRPRISAGRTRSSTPRDAILRVAATRGRRVRLFSRVWSMELLMSFSAMQHTPGRGLWEADSRQVWPRGLHWQFTQPTLHPAPHIARIGRD